MIKWARMFFLFVSCYAMGGEKPVAIITGGSRGVGYATAQLLAKKGYEVYATTRSPIRMMIYEEGLHIETVEITNSSSVRSFIQKVVETEGRIDLLINNASYGLAGPLETLKEEEIAEQMDVNFMAPIRMIKAVLPHMRSQKKGHIINISSTNGVFGVPYGSPYSASKAAIESLSEALAIELIPWNINVSIIEPGYITTHFNILLGSEAVENSPYADLQDSLRNQLKERDAHPEMLFPSQTPEEIAGFIFQVAQEEKPKLRYQTSSAAEKDVSRILRDLNGDIYLDWMQGALCN